MIMLAAAGASGLFIAWIDSRPTWDDTGVTVGLVLTVSAVFGFISHRRPWVWGLVVGVWVPILGLLLSANPASFLALVVAFAGAYAGAGVRKLFESGGSS